MQPPLPTLIFIPGAWHLPTCYNKVIEPLTRGHDFNCVSIILPSTQGDPAATFKNDLDAAQSAIISETTQGHDVIVIAHSYGGMVANSAIHGFTKPKHHHLAMNQPPTNRRSTDPQPNNNTVNHGYVTGLILIASGFTLPYLTFMAPLFNRPPPSWRANWASGFADLVLPPADFFYHDVDPPAEAEYWVQQLQPQSLKALFEGGEHSRAGWRGFRGQTGKLWYIGTTEDRGLPVWLQRIGVAMARGVVGAAEVVHVEVKSSHSPFLSRPLEVVGLIVDAVECISNNNTTGDEGNGAASSSVGKSETQGRVVAQSELISWPALDLWQPATWFKYGLPLGVGRLLGWCLAGFLWVRGW